MLEKLKYALLLALLLAFCACSKDPDFFHPLPGSGIGNTPPSRVPDNEIRRVLLLYSCGFNSLSSSLRGDIDELLSGKLPGTEREEDVILVFGHHVTKSYSVPSEAVLMRLYQENGEPVRDTLRTWPAGTVSASSATLGEVLGLVRRDFPAREYDLIFSSHATGWLPVSYYGGRDVGYEFVPTSVPDGCMSPEAMSGECLAQDPMSGEYFVVDPFTGGPLTRTIGETLFGSSGNYTVYNIELENFARAIPMKLNTIIFDCCLMGGVEVASALKDKCNYIVFSPAEVLSDGMDYTTLFEHFYASYTSDPVQVAEDYYSVYDRKTGVNRSATVSVVDCSKVKGLEECVASLMETCGDAFRVLDGRGVQQYYRYNYPYFFDLRDAFDKAGVSPEGLAALDRAIDDCVIYRKATDSFLVGYGGFEIDCYSGLSCYLPGAVSDSGLDMAYASGTWNRAVGVIR